MRHAQELAYDLNADGTPDFTRVLDRSQDSLQRDSGWQLKDGATIENQVTYAYDPAGRLGNVTSPAGSFTYAYQANSMGLISTVTSPAHTVTNTWESTRDVLARKQNTVGAAVISAYDYSVNPLGQRTEVAKTGSAFASNRSIAWGYDALGQVVKADSTAGFDRAYEFDGIGNRKKTADSLTLPATDNYTANPLNQYTAVDTINPAYDDDGNATAYPLPAHLSANSTLNWDAENRLISATVNGTTTTYLYDSGSRRIAQTTGSSTTVYVCDAWNPVAEYSGTTLAKTYTWGLDLSGSLQGAGGVGGLLAVTEASTSHFPTYDGNGNISEYLDAAGAAVAHYEYDPFGQNTVSTGTKWGDFAHRFSTKPIDYPTGLYYYGYRFMDPVTGRWPSRDPIRESGGLNLYAFVENFPTSRIDVLGLRDPTAGEKAVIDGLAKAATDATDPVLKAALPKVKAEIEAKIKALPDSDLGDKNHRAVIAGLDRLFNPTPATADAYKEWSVREKQHGAQANMFQCSRYVRAIVQEVEGKSFTSNPEAASFLNATDSRFESDTGIALPTTKSAGYGTITAGGTGEFGQNAAHVVLDLGNGLVVGHHPSPISDEYRRTVKVKDHQTGAEIEVSYDITIRKADRIPNNYPLTRTRKFAP